MSESSAGPSLHFLGGDEPEPRKRGRPRSAEPGSAVTTWLPASEHDRLVKLAQHRGESVSSVVRLLLQAKWQRVESK
jgi:hypothetical protein